MAKRRSEGGRKTRTREHVIGDLGVNWVERQVLLRGYTLESILHDYGYDKFVFVYSDNGEVEEGNILIQIKSTAAVERLQDGQSITFRLDRIDLQRWLREPYPVILCLYDATDSTAYWLYVQHYFESLPDFNLFEVGATVTVGIPVSQILTPEVVGGFADALRGVLRQLEGKVTHD